jgi:RNA polymerase sigma factor (sigma-70 family)
MGVNDTAAVVPAESLRAVLRQASEHRRLVGLCASISGDRSAAEDLAQETLLEAWRNLHKLRDAAGAERWLTAIARNVCRRWARAQGRETGIVAAVGADPGLDDGLDLELELERSELSDLLDRALALLPEGTRDVLVHRYVDELPHVEIAERLGVTSDAVSMRLSRGKVALRRLLADELRDEAAGYAPATAPEHAWRETRVWCPQCGRRKLLLRREPPPGSVCLRCPGCARDASGVSSELPLGNPVFAGLVADVVRPTAILARTSQWTQRYFAAGAGHDVACTRCGGSVRITRYTRDVPAGAPHRTGLVAECRGCGETVSTSVSGLALALPEVRRFRRDHPRTRALARELDVDGERAALLRYGDLLGHAGVDVVYSRATLRVLHVG